MNYNKTLVELKNSGFADIFIKTLDLDFINRMLLIVSLLSASLIPLNLEMRKRVLAKFLSDVDSAIGDYNNKTVKTKCFNCNKELKVPEDNKDEVILCNSCLGINNE